MPHLPQHETILAHSHCFDLPVGLSEDYFNNHGKKQQTTFHQANSKEFVLLYFSDKILEQRS